MLNFECLIIESTSDILTMLYNLNISHRDTKAQRKTNAFDLQLKIQHSQLKIVFPYLLNLFHLWFLAFAFALSINSKLSTINYLLSAILICTFNITLIACYLLFLKSHLFCALIKPGLHLACGACLGFAD